MAAPPPRSARRRARRGTLERPVNGRMYRGTWLLVGLPLLLVAFTVGRAEPLPAPTLPPAFDADAALALAQGLSQTFPDRSPGAPGSLGAAAWVADRFRGYGFQPQTDVFPAEIPGLGPSTLTNVYAVARGRSPDVVVVTAHRDDLGLGPGANDNASGTAVLIELARAYARADAGDAGGSLAPSRTIVFLSADGGAWGNLGAWKFARDPTYGLPAVAVLNLDAVAGSGPPRLEVAGDAPRSPSSALVGTASERLLEESGAPPRLPSALRQLVDLGFPFSLHAQAPFVARGVPALTITTVDGRMPPFGDAASGLDRERLAEVGRASQALLTSVDQGLELRRGGQSAVFVGQRVVRGWAIQLVLIAALLPYLAAAVDLFARCRRRRIPLLPALRSLRSRASFWLSVGALFAVLGFLGAWPGGDPRPPAPEASMEWPVMGLVVLGLGAAAAWLVTRPRLVPRRPATAGEQLAGHAAALLALGVLALVVIAVNPFALVFLLPSVHAWLWLPQLRERSAWLRLGTLALGFAGPLLLVGSIATRLELGAGETLRYLLALVSVGYVGPVAVVAALAWLAAAGQCAALAAGRYAAYPDAAERPPRGPLRELVRRTAAAVRSRRGSAAAEPEALHG